MTYKKSSTCCISAISDNSWLCNHVTFQYPVLCFGRSCCPSCNFHNLQKNVKIFERIKIISKRALTNFQRSRAKFELEKSYFDTTCHLEVLSYDKSRALMRARKKTPGSKCNPFAQARCHESRSHYAYVLNWEFLDFFSFFSFLFIFPVSIPTSMTGKPR